MIAGYESGRIIHAALSEGKANSITIGGKVPELERPGDDALGRWLGILKQEREFDHRLPPGDRDMGPVGIYIDFAIHIHFPAY